MKYSFIIAFVFHSIFCSGQNLSLFANRIAPKNEEFYYAEMKQLSSQNNIDSINRAINIIEDLYYFDSKKYNVKTLQPYLDKLNEFSYATILNRLPGVWLSEPMGTDWGGAMINLNKKIIFSQNRAFFYYQDSLVRVTNFKIISKVINGSSLNFKYFSIAFIDNKEEWKLKLISEGNTVPFHGEAKKLYLLISKEQHCVCGCPEELYSILQ